MRAVTKSDLRDIVEDAAYLSGTELWDFIIHNYHYDYYKISVITKSAMSEISKQYIRDNCPIQFDITFFDSPQHILNDLKDRIAKA